MDRREQIVRQIRELHASGARRNGARMKSMFGKLWVIDNPFEQMGSGGDEFCGRLPLKTYSANDCCEYITQRRWARENFREAEDENPWKLLT
jgi:hypothetical protein